MDATVSLATRIGDELRFALSAWVYFTRVPLPAPIAAWLGYEPRYLNGAARYFPLVGVVIGALGALVYLLALTRLPVSVAVLLSMCATQLLTGALHEDGLADCFDAFGGAYTREDALRIMRDSRIGAFGAIGLLLALGLKWAALSELSAPPVWHTAWLMIAAHAASRANAISLMFSLDYVREEGRARPVAQQLGWPAAVAALWFGGCWLLWPNWRWGLAALVALALLRALLASWYRRRLGGYTGDCLGLAQQLSELLVYLFALAWN